MTRTRASSVPVHWQNPTGYPYEALGNRLFRPDLAIEVEPTRWEEPED